MHLTHTSSLKNSEHDIYMFRQAKQETSESIDTSDTFHTRLRKLTETCEFVNVENEFKSQS